MTYSIERVATLIGARCYGEQNAMIGFLLTDSRSLCFPEETLFFALKTSNNDGHKFIPELYSLRVKNFVVEEILPEWEQYEGANFLVVKNALKALQKVAAQHRKRFQIPIEAGSSGVHRQFPGFPCQNSFRGRICQKSADGSWQDDVRENY